MIHVLRFSDLRIIFSILNISRKRNNTKLFIVFINNLDFRMMFNVSLKNIIIVFDLKSFKINIMIYLNY